MCADTCTHVGIQVGEMSDTVCVQYACGVQTIKTIKTHLSSPAWSSSYAENIHENINAISRGFFIPTSPKAFSS